MSHWKVDTSHASVHFEVEHLGFSLAQGQIFGVNGAIDFDPDNIQAAKIELTFDPTTITTGDKNRDGHLLSPDFFDVENHKLVKFESTEISQTAPDQLMVRGTLTIKGISNEVEVSVNHIGTHEVPKDDGGIKEVAAFSADTQLDRRDYGMNWNIDLPGGKLILGHTVKLHILLEAIKQV